MSAFPGDPVVDAGVVGPPASVFSVLSISDIWGEHGLGEDNIEHGRLGAVPQRAHPFWVLRWRFLMLKILAKMVAHFGHAVSRASLSNEQMQQVGCRRVRGVGRGWHQIVLDNQFLEFRDEGHVFAFRVRKRASG